MDSADGKERLNILSCRDTDDVKFKEREKFVVKSLAEVQGTV
jgi:hypothetical protein